MADYHLRCWGCPFVVSSNSQKILAVSKKMKIQVQSFPGQDDTGYKGFDKLSSKRQYHYFRWCSNKDAISICNTKQIKKKLIKLSSQKIQKGNLFSCLVISQPGRSTTSDSKFLDRSSCYITSKRKKPWCDKNKMDFIVSLCLGINETVLTLTRSRGYIRNQVEKLIEPLHALRR